MSISVKKKTVRDRNTRLENTSRDFSVFQHWPRVLSFHHPAMPAASRPARMTRAAFPMRVTVEGRAPTLELAVPR
jgi:hypothetical protein